VKANPLNIGDDMTGARTGSEHQERTLLLDACGVMLGEPVGPLFAAVAASAGKTPDAVAKVFRDRFRNDLWSGRSAEGTFWMDFARACGLDRPSESWRGVIDSSMHPMPALRRLQRWSQNARLILISNHRHEWLAPRLEALGVTRHFTELRISSVTGVVKPAPAAYAEALGGRAPMDTLYVDDKAANVAAARSLDIRSVLADADGLWMTEVETWLGC